VPFVIIAGLIASILIIVATIIFFVIPETFAYLKSAIFSIQEASSNAVDNTDTQENRSLPFWRTWWFYVPALFVANVFLNVLFEKISEGVGCLIGCMTMPILNVIIIAILGFANISELSFIASALTVSVFISVISFPFSVLIMVASTKTK
jgi:hypothetical protein